MLTGGNTYTADEGRDERNARLSAGNSLAEAEEKGKVAVNAVVTLELARSLNALPGGGDLDQYTLALDADRLVEGDELFGLLLRALLVEGQAGVDLGRDTAGNDLEDLLAELDELEGWGIRVLARRATIVLTRRSIAAFVWFSRSPPFSLPNFTAASMRRA